MHSGLGFFILFSRTRTQMVRRKIFQAKKLNIFRKSEHLKTKHGGALVAINDHFKHEEK